MTGSTTKAFATALSAKGCVWSGVRSIAILGLFFGALMLGVYDSAGRLSYVGHTGTGFSESMLKEVYDRLKPYFTDTCPFTPRPEGQCTGSVVKA